MANIAVTNTCNLRCPYCFAQPMKDEEAQFVTEEQMNKILAWMESKGKGFGVGLIGGEPTLHPQFDVIAKKALDFAIRHDAYCSVYTNGINLKYWLYNYMNTFTDVHMIYLINCNSPEIMGQDNYDNMIDSLDVCKAFDMFKPQGAKLRVTLGCNLFPTDSREYYDYFWELVERYHAPRVRVSVVTPCGDFASLKDKPKDEYFKAMKEVFLQFCANAIKHNCTVDLDCGYIPACYFNADEMRLLINAGINAGNFQKSCLNPIVDIKPDGTAVPCFGNYDDQISIYKFKDYDLLHTYFYMQNRVKAFTGEIAEQCAHCHDFVSERCQGGCLALRK